MTKKKSFDIINNFLRGFKVYKCGDLYSKFIIFMFFIHLKLCIITIKYIEHSDVKDVRFLY